MLAKFKTHLIKHKKKSILLFILLIWYYFSLPKKLFIAPTSTIIESKEGKLLGAKIAKDGQWRFPKRDNLPQKFEKCIVQFEDAYFYKHFGFNPISISKALVKNLQSKDIKRGGSTLTQQVIRLFRKHQNRTYIEKFKELILATRLELRYDKNEILNLYASNAPFGGNVVGIDAASWRYFGRKPENLSWAESATLAVLPNAPSLIYPGKNQKKLLKKRNRLLKKLWKNKIIDSITYSLSILEKLPQKPYELPKTAPHLLEKINKEHKGKKIKTSLDYSLQKQVNSIVKSHYNELKQNQIFNIAVLILDINTKKVLAYVGNSPTDKAHQKDVDIINKPRSTGSILKPFLYAAMLDQGELLPKTLISDIPTQIANYRPVNFNKKYVGAVFADEALSRSLNVPAVKMLQQFGVERFYHYLKKLDLKDIKYHASHYGLSLILGGAESNLWDISKSFANLSSTINHYDTLLGKYYQNEFVSPSYLKDATFDLGKINSEKTLFDAGSIFLTYQALRNVTRPEIDQNYKFYENAKEIAWKTGTSFGFRDAWAVGTTKNYVVGVWVGNADGEGRPGLVGVQAAAPILFEVFDKLPKTPWFTTPFDELVKVPICRKSGYRASVNCEQIDTLFIQRNGLKTTPCKYHKIIHLNQEETIQVNASCYPLTKMKHKKWFVLPPTMAYYYKQKNPEYQELPPFATNCIEENQQTIEFIYPKNNNTVFFLPKD
ncbi:MAG TPA: penicillin-binding protein 1C, partial [Flavobacteriia bacterium]|nr:penicillin-binding protein 1C [Flavobacteriia bacterium]